MPDVPPFAASDLAGNSGPLPTIRWKGAEYPVAHPCPKSVQELERYVRTVCYQRLDALTAEIQEARNEPWVGAIMETKAELKRQIVNREWAAFEPLYRAVLSSPSLRGNQLWACLKVAGGDLSFDQVDAMIRDEPEQVELLMGVLDRGFLQLSVAKIPGLRIHIPTPKPVESPAGIAVTPGSSANPSD